MRIVTFNANGIRSAATKGFFDWLKKQKADVVCLQETKSQEDQLTDPAFRPDGHHVFYRDATTKKGYSGVAIYSRREPDEVRTALGWAPFDDEGRYLEARYGNLSVVSLYVPSGSSGEERQAFKFKVMKWFKPVLDGWLASGRDYVLCGDWNIVQEPARHQELDIEPEELGLHCRPSASGSTASAPRTPAGSTRIARSNRKARTTPGGAIAAPRARRTSAGASTTRFARRALRDTIRKWSIAPATPRFSDHAPYTVDYAL